MQRTKSVRNQKGFTLVEIAIVLVIIGLLIGGILKGQEMVKSGKVKKGQKQMEQLVAAINAYQDKTGKLPGTTVASAGDCLIDLDDAGLITGSTLTNPFGGDLTATFDSTSGAITIVSPLIPDYAARKIDIAMDDGDAAAGDIIADNATYTSTDTTDDKAPRELTWTY